MSKVRISLTIDKDVVDGIDKFVDNINVKSRSQAIENFLREAVNKEKSVVILCGGKDFVIQGTDTLRPLALVGEKTVIERIILECRRYGFHKFYVVGPKKVLDKIYEITGKIKDAEIRYFEEKNSEGSAKALLQLKKELRSTFLLIPGDTVFHFDLKDMFDFHKKGSSAVTLALNILKKPEESHYKLGKVAIKGSKIVKYIDSSEEKELQVMSTFIFFAEPSIFSKIKQSINSLQKELFPELAKENQLSGYTFDGYWFNIHTKEDIEEASKQIK